MAVSVRMDPLLERELELKVKRLGVTKSQFIIDAVKRALGRTNPYELMMKLKAEEALADNGVGKAFAGTEESYDADRSRAKIVAYLKAKHGVSDAG